MKIPGVDPSGDLSRLFFQVQPKEISEKEPRHAHHVKSSHSGDAVDISTFSQEVQDLSAIIKNLPDIRDDRVREVREALERGQSLPTTNQLVNALIQDTIFNSVSSS